MRKLFVILIVCIASVIMVFGCVKQTQKEGANILYGEEKNTEVHADYVLYDDESSLIDNSDTIIIGEVIKVNEPEEIVIGKATKSPDSKALSFIYTVSDIKIQKVLKGNYKAGDIIKVKQLGDINNSQYAEDIKYYKKNSENVFFLMTFPETPASVLNPIQGQLELLEDGKIKVEKENKLFSKAKNKEDVINIIEKRVSSNINSI